MKKQNLIILSFLIIAHLNAQQTYQKMYGSTGNDLASDIVATKDGGNFIVGDTYSFGAINSDMYFVKTNGAGNIQWSKTLGISGYDHANAVILTSDGGYAVTGSTGGNSSHMVLLKLTAGGDVQWIRYFSANTRQSGSSLVQTPDGGYAIAGQVSTYNNGSWGYLVRTDSLGTLLWSKRIFDRGFYPEILDICNTYDGGFALAANIPTSAYYDMCLIKLGANGSFQWARSIGGSSTDIPSFVKQTSDSGYIMGGLSFSYGGAIEQNMFVVKTNSKGNKQWSRNIGTTKSETLSDVMEVPGGYVLVGTTDSSANSYRQIMLVKFRTNGKFLGTRVYNPPIDEGVGSINAVTTYNNNGFSIAGTSGSLYTGTQNVYVVKFNRAGNTCTNYSTYGNVKDTGNMITQKIPVSNANTSVSSGTVATIARTSDITLLCPNPTITTTNTSNDFSASKSAQRNIMLFPNPVQNRLQLQLTADNQTSAPAAINIFSADGKLIMNKMYDVKKGTNTISIQVGNIKPGLYLLQFSSAAEQQTMKFVKH